MAFWDNQSLDKIFYELREAIRTLQTQSPLRSSSITEGRLRVGGTAILLIDSDGGLVIDGSLNGEGELEWTGTVILKGTTSFEGDTTQKGPFHIEGATDLKGNMSVKPGGKITVEGSSPIVLSQVAGGAQMTLGDARLLGSGNGFGLGVGTRVFYSTLTGVVAQGGSNEVAVDASTGTTVTGGATVRGGLKIPTGAANLPTITGVTSNLYWDPATGQLKRIT